MELLYRNFDITIHELIGGEFNYHIEFGGRLIAEGIATDADIARKEAMLFVDDFITTLPPALSYQK